MHCLPHFLAELRGAFDMTRIAPLKALIVLDQFFICEANKNCFANGQDY